MKREDRWEKDRTKSPIDSANIIEETLSFSEVNIIYASPLATSS